MSHEILNMFVTGCIALLIASLVFFLRRFFTSVDELKQTIKELTTCVTEMKAHQDLQAFVISQHEEQIQRLIAMRCTKSTECPNADLPDALAIYSGPKRRATDMPQSSAAILEALKTSRGL